MRDEQIVTTALWESPKPFAAVVFALFQAPPPMIRHETAWLKLDYARAIHPSMRYAELRAVVQSAEVIRGAVAFKADDHDQVFRQVVPTRGGGTGMAFSFREGEVWFEWGGVGSEINAFSSMARAETLRREHARSLPLKVGDEAGRVVVEQREDGIVAVEARGVEAFVEAFSRLVDAVIPKPAPTPPARAESVVASQPRRRGRRAKMDYVALAKLKATAPDRFSKRFEALVMAYTRALVEAGVERDEARRRAYDAVKKGVQRASRALAKVEGEARADHPPRANRTTRDLLPPTSRSPRTTSSSRARSANTESSA